jgi:sugar phosphate permease
MAHHDADKVDVDRPGKWKARYTVLLFLWLGWMFSFLDRMIMNVSLPFIGKELSLDKAEQGMIVSAFFIGYAMFQIPGGALADRFGARKVMTVAIIWWSVFTSLTGFIFSLPIMLAVRFLFGIGEGCFPASSWKIISTYFPPKERGFATSIQSSVNTLGPALAVFVAAAIIQHFGWHMVFIILGIPGIVVGCCMYYFCRDNPADNPQITSQELAELDLNQISQMQRQGASVSIWDILRNPVLWKLSAIWFLFDITFWGFMTWLPSYLMEIRGLSLSSTGKLAAIPFLFGALGTLSGGYLSDRAKPLRKILYVLTSIASALGLYMTYTVATVELVVFYQCVSALFMFFAMALFWGMIMDYIPTPIMGRGSSIVNFGGQLAGVVSPTIIGHLIGDNAGNYDNAFIFMIVALVGSAAMTLTVRSNETVTVKSLG